MLKMYLDLFKSPDPGYVRIKNRTPFKRELKNHLLKLLENEEMNVDISCSEICKYLLIK